MDLEDELETSFNALQIDDSKRKLLNAFLNRLDKETRKHSIRVALIGVKIATYLKWDTRAMLYGGLLHDVGKTFIEQELLDKKERFNEADMERIRAHTVKGYSLLVNEFPFSAEIALRHHLYQESPYPKDVQPKPGIDEYAKLVSLIDCYDAIKTRNGGEKLSRKEVKERLLTKKHDDADIIHELYIVDML